MRRLGYSTCALLTLLLGAFSSAQSAEAADVRIIKSDFVLQSAAYVKSGKKREPISCFRRVGSRLRLGIVYTKRGRKYLKDFSYRNKVLLNQRQVKRNDILSLCYLLITASSSSNGTSQSSSTSSTSSSSSSAASSDIASSSSNDTSSSSVASSSSTQSSSSSSSSIDGTPVCTALDLSAIQNDLTAKYVQVCDIDLAGVQTLEPIGSGATPFAGSFDGNGFSIKNYHPAWIADEDYTTQYGIFGFVQDATLRNITIKDSHLPRVPRSTGAAAFLAQYLINTKLSNIKILSSSITSQNPNTTGYIASIATYLDNVIASDLLVKDFAVDSRPAADPYYIQIGGVFGEAKNVSIRNVQISNISLRSSAGGVSGLGASLTAPAILENVQASGEVINSSNGSVSAGLVGVATGNDPNALLSIQNVSFSGAVSATADVGGLFGQVTTAAQISQAFFTGTVTSSGAFSTGGIAGTAAGLESAPLEIRNSQVNGIVAANDETAAVGGAIGWGMNLLVDKVNFNGDVHGGNSAVLGGRVGGLFGWVLNSSVSRAQSTGRMFGGQRSGMLGGVAGMAATSQIRDSYFEGAIFGEGARVIAGLIPSLSATSVLNCYVGGGAIVGGSVTNPTIYGLTGGNMEDVVSSYWDVEQTGVAQSRGGVGKTHAEMVNQSTYAAWDFTSIWNAPAAAYPTLK